MPVRYKSPRPCAALSKSLVYCLCLAASTLPGYALAKDKPQHQGKPPAADDEAKAGWSGAFSFGLNSITGNTNKAAANADLEIVYDTQKSLKHTLAASADYGDRSVGRGKNRTETQDAKTATYKLDYILNPKDTLIGYVGYESDLLAKLDTETSVGAAYSRKLIQTKRHKLSGSLGAAYVSREYTDKTPDLNEPAARIAFDYKGKITDKISINERLVVLVSDAFTTSRAKTSLKYALSENASLVLKHEVTHNTFIPVTAIDKTDSTTKLNLEIEF